MSANAHSGSAPRPTFEDVYRLEFDYVYRSLRRLGVPDKELLDLAHDTFLVVFRKLASYDPARPLRAWLFGIAFRVVSEYRSRPVQQRETSDEELAAIPINGEAEARVQGREARETVLAALDRLTPDKRAVFVMHELDGCAAPEIAEALSIPVNTVYSRLRVARQDFVAALQTLQREEGES
jgi:RNA polymerase sigma-70 factor (ECF subfamily)